MSRWPVVDPPKVRQRINLRIAPIPDPITFDGPLNVLIQLYGTATAATTAAQVKHDYEAIYPPPVAATSPFVPDDETLADG
ncbi:hypothetical protein [Bradyrhizobium japonicum]|uniref:hypothetical protein n=1 Tax=Bradyrhizobium japonicum TaxID=375 RepID=UPI00200E324F|nr:hypothetical protein [Bradyrhizobium japonicum]UQD96088.1 hypothetical protein JEY30_31595 [Bradyrhizobium japonicum]